MFTLMCVYGCSWFIQARRLIVNAFFYAHTRRSLQLYVLMIYLQGCLDVSPSMCVCFIAYKRGLLDCLEMLIIIALGALVTLFFMGQCIVVMDRLYGQYIWVAAGVLPVWRMTAVHCGTHAEESNKTILQFYEAKIN